MIPIAGKLRVIRHYHYHWVFLRPHNRPHTPTIALCWLRLLWVWQLCLTSLPRFASVQTFPSYETVGSTIAGKFLTYSRTISDLHVGTLAHALEAQRKQPDRKILHVHPQMICLRLPGASTSTITIASAICVPNGCSRRDPGWWSPSGHVHLKSSTYGRYLRSHLWRGQGAPGGSDLDSFGVAQIHLTMFPTQPGDVAIFSDRCKSQLVPCSFHEAIQLPKLLDTLSGLQRCRSPKTLKQYCPLKPKQIQPPGKTYVLSGNTRPSSRRLDFSRFQPQNSVGFPTAIFVFVYPMVPEMNPHQPYEGCSGIYAHLFQVRWQVDNPSESGTRKCLIPPSIH